MGTLQLVCRQVDTLPRLAWCATIRKHDRTIRVLHGPHVEVADNFFCDGAWSGDFASADFDKHLLMGSAGKVVGDRLLIASPNHTMERIYLLRSGASLLVSNSCAFVLAQSDDEPDPNDLSYSTRLSSIIRGIDQYERWIPTRRGNRIHVYCHCNIQVGMDHQVVEAPKAPEREFVDFADYRSFLEEATGAIASNASDSRRKIQYRPLATISSGYDSPASAVFAWKAGCKEAITIRRSRPRGGSDMEDSGEGIASILGMKVQAFDRFDYLQRTDLPEVEGGITEFLSYGDCLERRLLFTGFNDVVWDRSAKMVSPYIRRKDTSGNSLAELRLRSGFVHLPVPYLGCTSHSAIHRISNSQEMLPWCVGGNYDKPIPRRLVEEAGVGRQMFGVVKKAAAIVPQEEGFERAMTRESRADFSRFFAEVSTPRLHAKLGLCKIGRSVAKVNRELRWTIAGLSSRMSGGRVALQLPVVIPAGIERVGAWGRYSLLFHWSMRRLRSRYLVGE